MEGTVAEAELRLTAQLQASTADQSAAAAAAATATAATAAQDLAAAKASVKSEVVDALEKKMHAALDAALATIRKEAGQAAGAGGGKELSGLRHDFDEMRNAIKRNAMWLLQAPA